FFARAIAATRDSVRAAPGRPQLRFDLAYLLFVNGQLPEARELYRALEPVMPDNLDLWENLAICEHLLKDPVAERATLERGLAACEAQQDTARAGRLRAALERLTLGAPATP